MRKLLVFLLVACRGPSSSPPTHIAPLVTDHETNLGAIDTQFAGALLASYHKQIKETVAPLSLTPTDGSELALTGLRADITIEGPLAHTELHLTFHNTEARQREGRFQITLPPGAAVGRFAMLVAGQWREAHVIARASGQKMFEGYLHQKVDPALLEQDHGNGFSARVFPIPAHADKELVIAYDHTISEMSPYRLALAGLPKTDRLAISIEHDGKTTTRNLDHQVPTDVIVETQRGDLAVAAGDAFVARVDLAASAVKQPLDHVVMLVDTSASRAPIMGRQAEVVEQLIANLPDDAELTVDAFDVGVTELYRGRARDAHDLGNALHRHGALGGSDLGGALARAATDGAARVIVIGDGTPTLGEHRSAELASWVKGVERVDAVQIGQTIDRDVLGPIVAAGRYPGAILDSRELHHVVAGLETVVGEPQTIVVRGALETWPATTAGLAPGEPAFVTGHRAPGQNDPIEVKIGGRIARITPIAARQAHVDRAIGMAHIAELTAKLARASDAERPAIQKQLEQLGIDNNVVTGETSLIVLENDQEERRQFGSVATKPDAGGGEVIRISGTAPVIDQGSTKTGITLTEDYTNNVPVGRTFGAVLGASAGSQSFSGASSVENTYITERGQRMTMAQAEPEWIVDQMTREAMAEKAAREPEPTPPAHVEVRVPIDPDPSTVPPYTSQMSAVMKSIAAGDRTGALATASAWEVANPGDVAALIGLGEALEARGSLLLAERAYTSIIDLYPDRTELVRAAGERLDRIPGARSLAIDAYRRAIRERPDQLSTYRLLAYDLMTDHKTEAIAAIDAALKQPIRHWSVGKILQEDRDIIAGSAKTPSIRFILSWETDTNDVDLHVRDHDGNHAWYSHLEIPNGALLEDVRDGYGPEIFASPNPTAFPYKIGVHYYARGPEGVGLGSVQIIRNDTKRVTVENRPFMIMNDQAFIDLGTVTRE
ncbi:MAG: VIT domain-containing protein [Kofleriaceae bacterium]